MCKVYRVTFGLSSEDLGCAIRHDVELDSDGWNALHRSMAQYIKDAIMELDCINDDADITVSMDNAVLACYGDHRHRDEDEVRECIGRAWMDYCESCDPDTGLMEEDA